MFQLNFTFDIIIYPRRVNISESFYLIRYEITENVQRGFIKQLHWGVDIFTIKGVFRIKGFDSQVYGINISFFYSLRLAAYKIGDNRLLN